MLKELRQTRDKINGKEVEGGDETKSMKK